MEDTGLPGTTDWEDSNSISSLIEELNTLDEKGDEDIPSGYLSDQKLGILLKKMQTKTTSYRMVTRSKNCIFTKKKPNFAQNWAFSL